VRTYTNRDLAVRGVIATMFDGRTKLARQVVEEVREAHGLEVFDPPVPKSVKVAEAPGRGRSILEHAPGSKAAVAYRELTERIFGRAKKAKRKERQ
jgi:chromosome partitioning protein